MNERTKWLGEKIYVAMCGTNKFDHTDMSEVATLAILRARIFLEVVKRQDEAMAETVNR